MTKSKIPILTATLAVIVIAVTVFLFYFLNTNPEKTTLFFFNLGYVCFLELVLFFYIGLMQFRSGITGGSSVAYASIGTVLIYYLILGGLITLLYNLFFTQSISVNIFISVIIIGTVITIVLAGFLAQTGIHHQESITAEAINSEKVTALKTEFELSEKKFRRLIKEKGITGQTESNFGSELEKVSGIIRFLPHNALEQESNFNRLSDILKSINTFVDNFVSSTETNPEELKKSINSFVQNTLDQLEVFKRTIRK
jgi:hypothetical protein